MSASGATTLAVEVLPHEFGAVLLERAWIVDPRTTQAIAVVRPGTPFGEQTDDWPAWLAIEMMAQTVAAGAGLREFRPGVRPTLGLLLGVRQLTCMLPAFGAGSILRLEAVESTRDDNGLGVFDCTLDVDGQFGARATLSVYLPPSVNDYLREINA